MNRTELEKLLEKKAFKYTNHKERLEIFTTFNKCMDDMKTDSIYRLAFFDYCNHIFVFALSKSQVNGYKKYLKVLVEDGSYTAETFIEQNFKNDDYEACDKFINLGLITLNVPRLDAGDKVKMCPRLERIFTRKSTRTNDNNEEYKEVAKKVITERNGGRYHFPAISLMREIPIFLDFIAESEDIGGDLKTGHRFMKFHLEINPKDDDLTELEKKYIDDFWVRNKVSENYKNLGKISSITDLISFLAMFGPENETGRGTEILSYMSAYIFQEVSKLENEVPKLYKHLYYCPNIDYTTEDNFPDDIQDKIDHIEKELGDNIFDFEDLDDAEIEMMYRKLNESEKNDSKRLKKLVIDFKFEICYRNKPRKLERKLISENPIQEDTDLLEKVTKLRMAKKKLGTLLKELTKMKTSLNEKLNQHTVFAGAIEELSVEKKHLEKLEEKREEEYQKFRKTGSKLDEIDYKETDKLISSAKKKIEEIMAMPLYKTYRENIREVRSVINHMKKEYEEIKISYEGNDLSEEDIKSRIYEISNEIYNTMRQTGLGENLNDEDYNNERIHILHTLEELGEKGIKDCFDVLYDYFDFDTRFEHFNAHDLMVLKEKFVTSDGKKTPFASFLTGDNLQTLKKTYEDFKRLDNMTISHYTITGEESDADLAKKTMFIEAADLWISIDDVYNEQELGKSNRIYRTSIQDYPVLAFMIPRENEIDADRLSSLTLKEHIKNLHLREISYVELTPELLDEIRGDVEYTTTPEFYLQSLDEQGMSLSTYNVVDEAKKSKEFLMAPHEHRIVMLMKEIYDSFDIFAQRMTREKKW